MTTQLLATTAQWWNIGIATVLSLVAITWGVVYMLTWPRGGKVKGLSNYQK